MTHRSLILSSLALAIASSMPALSQTPVRYEDQRFVPRDLLEAGLGNALTLEGGRAFVSHRGSAAIFPGAGAVWNMRRGADGLMFIDLITAQPQLTAIAFDLDAGDGLLALGSFHYGLPNTPSGRVYLYDTVDPITPMIATLDRPVAYANSTAFGRAVCVIDRETVAVGAFGDSFSGCCGTVHVYTEMNGAWSMTQELRPVLTGTSLSTRAGTALASDGDTLVIGGLAHHMWVFERDATGSYSEVAELIDPVPSGSNSFGRSVAIEGDLIAVGDARNLNTHLSRTGSVYLFRRVAGAWGYEARLEASDDFVIGGQISAIHGRFGTSVDISNGRVVVGAMRARRHQPPEDSRPGSAYVFQEEGGVWTERYRLWHTGREYQAEFGAAVSIDGDTVLVGAPAEIVGVNRAGSLSVYHLPFGDVICDGVTNSSGNPATLEVTGERRVAFGHLDVEVFDAPVGAFGYLLASQMTGSTIMPGGSQGTLCLGGSISRFRSDATAANAAGRMNFDLDMQAFPTPQSGLVMLQPGDRWAFQVWYRDANPMPTSNFSAAVGVTFR